AAMTLSAFLGFMLTHLWQSTLFGGACWLLIALVLRDNRAQVRYAWWLAASIKFLIPFAMLSAIGSKLGWLRQGAAPARAGLSYMLDQFKQRVIPSNLAPVAAPQPTGTVTLNFIPYLLLIVWAFGVLGVAIVWWLRARQIRAAVRGAKPFLRYRGVDVLS